MPSNAELEEWVADQYSSTAAYFDDPDAWFDDQIQLHTDESEQSIPIIKRLLEDQINTSTDAAHRAASDLARICKCRLEINERVQMPLGLWLVMCRAIQHFAGEATSIAKLSALLVELSKIDVRDAGGSIMCSQEGRLSFWSELPGWNLSFRDHLTGVFDRGSYTDESDTIVQWKQRFHNGNLFQAYWLSHIGTSLNRQYLYATSLALQTLREALEAKMEESTVGRQRTKHYVMGILPWIFEAGASLLQLCHTKHRHDGVTKVYTPPAWDDGIVGYTYLGYDGFHMERWDFWKASLRRVAEIDGIGHEVATKAVAGAEEMSRLEGR